jgi:uncharacterized caspase-like protein
MMDVRRAFLSIVGAMLLVAILGVRGAEAERRMALVIGNGNYEVGPLDNPVNDAALMSETLNAAGFEVTHVENLDYRAMQRAVVGFGRDLRAAGSQAVGMVYYAGHAIQANGENYLIPIDANIQDALDLEIQTLKIDTLLRSLEAAGNRMNMIVLDACRNNPFKAMSRSGSRGLAKIDAARGTLLAYSTAPGEVATDGSGSNSPYTRALAKAIRTPGLPVEQVFKRVRIEVLERTGERQVPWESSSLTGDFIFMEKTPEPVAETPAPAPDPATPDPNAEIEYWKAVAATNDAAAYRSYIARYPEGLFADLAQQRLAALDAGQARAARQQYEAEARAAWDAVKDSSDAAVVGSVAERYPDTVYAELARVKSDSLRQIAASRASAGSANQQTAALPSSASAETDRQTENLFWQSIKDSPNKSDYEAYLSRYPDGTFATIARERAENGYEPRIASLTPAAPANPIDGDWLLTIETTIPNPQAGFCRWGEAVSETVTVSNGEMDTRVKTNMGKSAQIKMKLSEVGASYFAKPQGWGQHLFYGSLDRQGEIFTAEIFITMSNARCKQTVTLRRP